MDSSAAEKFNKVFAISCSLATLLFEQNDSTDVLFNVWSCEKQFTVSASVFLSVLYVDGSKPLANGASALICS